MEQAQYPHEIAGILRSDIMIQLFEAGDDVLSVTRGFCEARENAIVKRAAFLGKRVNGKNGLQASGRMPAKLVKHPECFVRFFLREDKNSFNGKGGKNLVKPGAAYNTQIAPRWCFVRAGRVWWQEIQKVHNTS